jgi:hypothetical protein
LTAVLLGALAPLASAGPPAQKLPSALVVFPLVESNGVSRETRVQLVNLSNETIDLQCFYVHGDTCGEIGFFLSMTANQPISWLASQGYNNIETFSRIPPFFGEGELKCAVLPRFPEVEYHNVLQGRASVFGTDGQAVAYSATAFRRLTDGDFTGVISMDGVTYEQCPNKLHFIVLAETPSSQSELVLVPCTQDLLNQVPTEPNVQFLVINEFEQSFSASIRFECFDRRRLTSITNTLDRNTLGTDTAHIIVRGSSFSVIGLAIDRLTFDGFPLTSGNDPSFEGGRSATVTLP